MGKEGAWVGGAGRETNGGEVGRKWEYTKAENSGALRKKRGIISGARVKAGGP